MYLVRKALYLGPFGVREINQETKMNVHLINRSTDGVCLFLINQIHNRISVYSVYSVVQLRSAPVGYAAECLTDAKQLSDDVSII